MDFDPGAMSSPVQLTINLEYADHVQDATSKQKSFFKPGDVMEGMIIMTVSTSIRVRTLTLHVFGQGHTAWEVNGKKKTYQGRETYLDLAHALLGADNSLHTFNAGVHQFAFLCILPETLPSTFSGTYGSIAYTATASLESEDDQDNTVTMLPFMVLRRDPLPERAYHPLDLYKSKTYVGLKLGKVRAYCSLPHGVAVPGSDINVNAEVNNWSEKDITLLQGSLVLEAKFKAKGNKELTFRQYLGKREDFFDVNLKWGRRWRDVKINVPPYLADSGLRFCNIIDIEYIFEFRVQIKGSEDVIVKTPMYVGYFDDVMMADPKAMLLNRMFMNAPSSYSEVGRPLPPPPPVQPPLRLLPPPPPPQQMMMMAPSTRPSMDFDDGGLPAAPRYLKESSRLFTDTSDQRFSRDLAGLRAFPRVNDDPPNLDYSNHRIPKRSVERDIGRGGGGDWDFVREETFGRDAGGLRALPQVERHHQFDHNMDNEFAMRNGHEEEEAEVIYSSYGENVDQEITEYTTYTGEPQLKNLAASVGGRRGLSHMGGGMGGRPGGSSRLMGELHEHFIYKGNPLLREA